MTHPVLAEIAQPDDYDELPEAVKGVYSRAEYLWLSGEDDPELVARLQDVLNASLALGRPWPSGPLAFWMWKLGLLDTVPEGSAECYRWMMTGEYRRAVRPAG